MSKQAGGLAPPGQTWGGPEQPEAFHPVVRPTAAQIKAMRDGLSHCYTDQSRNDFLKTWIRDWTEHKLACSVCQPIPLSERNPEPKDCDKQGCVWWGSLDADNCWNWMRLSNSCPHDTHWLPASTRFLPARVQG